MWTRYPTRICIFIPVPSIRLAHTRPFKRFWLSKWSVIHTYYMPFYHRYMFPTIPWSLVPTKLSYFIKLFSLRQLLIKDSVYDNNQLKSTKPYQFVSPLSLIWVDSDCWTRLELDTTTNIIQIGANGNFEYLHDTAVIAQVHSFP